MTQNPLAEIFGFPPSNTTENAKRYRHLKLCPFNNVVPSCTKDKAQNPLGICSINDRDGIAITCPVRFREDWLIAEDASKFFFPTSDSWTSLSEIRLTDVENNPAGNIDLVLVSYNSNGKITDFGALEVQGVYISGNVRRPFEKFIDCEKKGVAFDWSNEKDSPRADYLSSSRKRLLPQMVYKGGILNSWGKKMAVAIHEGFFDSLPKLPVVEKSKANVAWLIYSLQHNHEKDMYTLTREKIVYTRFREALDSIVLPRPGKMDAFVNLLQAKLDEKLGSEIPPETFTLSDILKKDKE